MTPLADWLSKIEKCHPQSIEMGLDRILIVANRLNVLKFDCPVITVGGTNGKGSCVRLIESIFQAQGYKVGTYTSPHLLYFNERIHVDNQMQNDSTLIAAFEQVEAARREVPLTFFEFTTLAALYIFQQAKLDLLVLEVGLGGRLDAVNIIDADIAIIASIDLDHTDWLGSNREEIGVEKAGIFKQKKYAICGDQEPPQSIFQEAKRIGCQLFTVNVDFRYEINQADWNWSFHHFYLKNLPLPNLSIQNAATILMAVRLLCSKLPVSKEAIVRGLASAILPGRFQIIEQPRFCILDVAHNPASARLLASRCQSLPLPKKFIAVVGMLADKDIAGTLEPLLSLVSSWHVGTLGGIRGAPAHLLIKELQDFGVKNCYNYECVADAFNAVIANIQYQEKILVFGSFYTVAEILHLLENVHG